MAVVLSRNGLERLYQGAKMYNLENANAYESERRKDEMREAAESQQYRHLPRRKSPARLLAILAIVVWLVTNFIG
jgi:hypothetical protein